MNPYAAPNDPRITRGVLDQEGDALGGYTDTERPEWREPSEPVNLWDLPIFAWAWREDGKDLRA